jgi:hypothetical protein
MESEHSDHLGLDDQQSLYILIKKDEYVRARGQGYKGSWDDYLAGRSFADETDSRHEPDSGGLADYSGVEELEDGRGGGAFAHVSETIEAGQRAPVPPSQPTFAPSDSGRPISTAQPTTAPSAPATGSGAVEARVSQRSSTTGQAADRVRRPWHGTWAVGTVVVLLLALLSWLAYRSLVFPALASRARTQTSPTAAINSGLIAVTPGYLPTSLPSQPTPSLPALKTSLPLPSPSPLPTPGSPGVDRVLAFNPGPGANKEYGNPEALLGDPDGIEKPRYQGILQLGRGGSVLAAFTDNSIIDGPGPDFQIYGESAKDDFLLVEVSADGQLWRAYPKLPESTGPLDLADVGLSQAFYVRLTDLQPATATGAEVDAVVALHSGPPPVGGLQTLPDAVARTRASLLQGPDPATDELGQRAPGDTVSLLGRNHEGTWLLVSGPTSLSAWCPVANLGLNFSWQDMVWDGTYWATETRTTGDCASAKTVPWLTLAGT